MPFGNMFRLRALVDGRLFFVLGSVWLVAIYGTIVTAFFVPEVVAP